MDNVIHHRCVHTRTEMRSKITFLKYILRRSVRITRTCMTEFEKKLRF